MKNALADQKGSSKNAALTIISMEGTPLSHLNLDELKTLKKDAQNRKNNLNAAIRKQDCEMTPEQNLEHRDLTEEIFRIDLAISLEMDFEDAL